VVIHKKGGVKTFLQNCFCEMGDQIDPPIPQGDPTLSLMISHTCVLNTNRGENLPRSVQKRIHKKLFTKYILLAACSLSPIPSYMYIYDIISI
jgi:hypothetical protein